MRVPTTAFRNALRTPVGGAQLHGSAISLSWARLACSTLAGRVAASLHTGSEEAAAKANTPVADERPGATPDSEVQSPKPAAEGDAASLPLSLRDALVAYKSRSLGELLRAVAVFHSCKFPWLVANAMPLIETGRRVSRALTDTAIKKTYFAHFCAGETEEEVKPLMKKLDLSHVGSILDYAAEADLSSVQSPNPNHGAHVYLQKTEDHCDGNLDKYMKAIALATHAAQGTGVVAVKLTSLVNPCLLQRMSSVSAAREVLTPEEQQLVKKAEERVHLLGQSAETSKVRMLVDAEQSYFQPEIDRLAMVLMRNYNTKEAVVFNTYQCYLKDSHDKLRSHLAQANAEGWKMGAKLVRGAYMTLERERAAEQGYPSPVHDTIENTHDSFNRSMGVMLHAVREGGHKVVIASHNEQSILKAMRIMEELGLDNSTSGVMFGQLHGMCDFLTYSLSAKGYHAYKYLPYGPLHEVMPYLIRRAQENSGVLSTTDVEKFLMLAEVKRRLQATLYPASALPLKSSSSTL